MTELLLLKFIHLLLFVYWLGGDLGTFYASRFLVRPELTVAQRSTALTIMMGVDQGPRFCMPLMLPTGIHLGAMLGLIQLSALAIAAFWGLGLAWLAMVVVLHLHQDQSFLQRLGRVDFHLRWLVVVLCALLAATAWFADPWLTERMAAKLLIFAGMVGSGLGIRLALKPFMQAWVAMQRDGVQPQHDQAMNKALAVARRYVFAIWCGLLVNAAIGIHLIQI
ncbi:hypothetical protein QWY20_16675 [Alkalimonas sp. MEB108]|uniref:Copper resistance protein D domain-containing protein n=1 Tax=Alkalimonas cellulosilytica TaxID=3058395 RepID=A0ABU7J9B2_9GAMM|nr:hypothetical protein [Alkalimonas sp. MEB108]MEE2003096.1 hypothetical protein [Alkalimonas sp. MEB108]